MPATLATLARLPGFDVDAFLRDHWQRKPLLIRNPWGEWHNPLEPDELAGLACEPHIESRLITLESEDWNLENGPLPEDRFARLGRAPWTLLVQAVDHYVPEVAALVEPFRFIPNWRIDDVMVSYAVAGGGVGAHFDQYDVFLIQGLGTRRWQLGELCDGDTPLLAHDGLRLLAEFDPVEDWVLEPGDILYVPPRVAHKGVALSDDCMTYSVGFRAPSRCELIAGWSDNMLDEIDDDDRYTDTVLDPAANPGEIPAEALARLHALATEGLRDSAGFARWFGGYATAPKNPEIDWQPEEPQSAQDVADALAQGCALIRNPASRFAFVRETDGVMLFVDGEDYPCDGPVATFAETLCAASRVSAAAVDDTARELVLDLLNQGALAFEETGRIGA
ncbi:JmjC domain-containing protein [Tsuneonella suprasediminis]|uniref:JmjC domain-containing protein n=1 Tax=Tsuneonella suprasediminis TaxID=2306996 RepID=UPI0039C9C0E2